MIVSEHKLTDYLTKMHGDDAKTMKCITLTDDNSILVYSINDERHELNLNEVAHPFSSHELLAYIHDNGLHPNEEVIITDPSIGAYTVITPHKKDHKTLRLSKVRQWADERRA